MGFSFSGCSSGGAWALECMGSVAVVLGLSCSVGLGIFPDQGSNWCSLALPDRFLTTGPSRKFGKPCFEESLQPST